VILDLTLPDMDGLQFLRQLRARYGANMPAIVERLLDDGRLFVDRVKAGGGAPRPSRACQ
jgi:DNA-binding response OmpR family regulator